MTATSPTFSPSRTRSPSTIVDQLKVKLLPEEKKAIEQAPTENVEAYTSI